MIGSSGHPCISACFFQALIDSGVVAKKISCSCQIEWFYQTCGVVCFFSSTIASVLIMVRFEPLKLPPFLLVRLHPSLRRFVLPLIQVMCSLSRFILSIPFCILYCRLVLLCSFPCPVGALHLWLVWAPATAAPFPVSLQHVVAAVGRGPPPLLGLLGLRYCRCRFTDH